MRIHGIVFALGHTLTYFLFCFEGLCDNENSGGGGDDDAVSGEEEKTEEWYLFNCLSV